MNSPPLFNAQFIDDDGQPLAAGLLYTYVTGTTTPLTTYQDQAGTTPNTNPIVLDAAGRCDLWLSTTDEYTLTLKRADLTLVKTWDDVSGSAAGTSGVTSVNGETGVVVLTADEIDFSTGTSTTWGPSGTVDIADALDTIIERVDNGITASAIPIVDAGGLIASTNVESALQELAGGSFALPTQTGNSGKFLGTNGTTPSWSAPPASGITIADAGGYLASTNVEGALQEVAASAAAASLPAQAGNTGKFLSTDGSNTSWALAGTGSSTQAATGSITFPGGLIMKWGKTASLLTDTADNVVTFAVAFPNNCFQVICSCATGYAVGMSTEAFSVAAHTVTAAGFKIDNDSTAQTVAWFAIGN